MDENMTLVKTRSVSSNYGSSYQEIPLNDSVSLRRSFPGHDSTQHRNSSEKDIQDFKTLTIGYTFVFLINVGYTVSLIAAQLSVGETSIFQLNLMRFGFEALIAICLVKCGGHSLAIKRNDIYLIFVMMVSYYVYNVCYYFSPSVLPVGNMQASFTAILIICAVLIDLVLKHVNRSSIISAVICCSGLILLIQPWDYEIYKDIYGLTPCDIWDSGCSFKNISSYGSNNSCANVTSESGKYHYILGVSINGTLLGYLLVVFGAIGLAITFNIVRKMSFTYPVPVLVFWVDILLCIVSAIITGAALGDNWTFPSGFWCLLTTICFITCTVIDNLLCFYGYHYLPVSQVTLGVAPTTVSLYICQRTFLNAFHPGHANALEEFGIALVVIGATLSQILSIVGDCGRLKQRYKAVKEHMQKH